MDQMHYQITPGHGHVLAGTWWSGLNDAARTKPLFADATSVGMSDPGRAKDLEVGVDEWEAAHPKYQQVQSFGGTPGLKAPSEKATPGLFSPTLADPAAPHEFQRGVPNTPVPGHLRTPSTIPIPRPKPTLAPPPGNRTELTAPPPATDIAVGVPGAASVGPVVKMAYPMPGKDVKQHGDDAAFDAAFPMHILDRMFAEKEAKAAPASSGYGTITPAVYGAIPADNSSAPGSSTYAADAATAPASPFKPDPLGLALAKAMGPEAPAHMQKYLAQEPAEDFAANGNGYGVDPYAPQMTAQAAIDPFAGLHPEAVTALLRNLGFDPDPYA